MIHRLGANRITAGVACYLSFRCFAPAALVYGIPGSTYSQNFNSLPSAPQYVSFGSGGEGGWTDDNALPPPSYFSIPGWYLYHQLPIPDGGPTLHRRFQASDGAFNTASFMSFGVSGSSERALGDVGGNAIAESGGIYIALCMTNTTGVTLDRFTVSFAGEQWRDAGTLKPQSMTFSWSIDASSVTDPASLFTPVPQLAFSSPIFVALPGDGRKVDGNSVGRVNIPEVTILGVNWQPGDNLWLRWNDINHPGEDDHGLAIDDFFFSAAIPEPSGISLLGLGALAAARRTRLSHRS